MGVEVRQVLARGASAVAFSALLLWSTPPADAAQPTNCQAVTRGSLADVAAAPGLIVVADVQRINEPGTPASDTFAIREIIRLPPDPVFDLSNGTLATAWNECWDGLQPGDRIVAIFPFPDAVVHERSVAWRIETDGTVTQVSHQDVTGVPVTSDELIRILRANASGVPDTSATLAPLAPATVMPIAAGLAFAVSLVGALVVLGRRGRHARQP